MARGRAWWLTLAGVLAAGGAPAAQAPVNPAVSVITYACRDGSNLIVGYPDRQTAVVTWRNHAYALKLAQSAHGARYAGYGLQWWTDDEATGGELARLAPSKDSTPAGRGVICTAQPDKGSSRI